MESLIKNMENDPVVQEVIRNLSTSHFDKICRSCLLQQDDVKPIFKLTFENVDFSTLFETCASVQVNEDDGLPKNICDNCIQNFIHLYCFISKCQHSNEVLRLVAKNENAKQVVREHFKSKTSESGSEKKHSNEILRLIEVNENTEQKQAVQEAIKLSLDVNCSKTNNNRIVSHSSYVCNFCNLNFNAFHELQEHKKQEKHPKGYNRVCSICQKVISRGHLSQHMRIHTKEKPYQCEICSEKFNLHSNLKRHIKTHTGERPHTCDICGKGFIQSTTLREHRRIHTGETPYICCYCGKRFKQYAQHAIHLRKHQIENLETDEYGKSDKCEACNKFFSTKSALNTHMLLHGDKKFLCSECGKDFYTNSGLLSHLKVHTGNRPYTCNVCGKAFTQLNSLKSHELVHKGLKPFVCEICSKAYRQRAHLTTHLRTHSGEKPYTCAYCGKSFSSNGTLTVHIRIHTGETPYVCDVCGKGFHDSSSMKKHKKGHKPKNVIK